MSRIDSDFSLKKCVSSYVSMEKLSIEPLAQPRRSCVSLKSVKVLMIL
jgi:hypothetical protein